ncbi:hypothetical protein AM493_08655 [Flavobacterium akiainvivens]|uniref:DNA topoisomerase IV n=1 Tax=Flavobacterium akiainvivens TaxID=1202724 RepID=A0A0M9VHZ0_9FLAO|nr:DUF4252 domain-containing protein [Flavobacterium akiainvivens]KOS06100.1 hypothetical protein AM493_08655 [Flavobacterium akiainvivens]SFQ54925.1 protein of unknown function [Flavobacterium akiainvivens]
MKKFVIALLIAMLPVASFAQDAFAKFEDVTEITSIIVNKKMFELMGQVKLDPKDKEGQKYLALVKKLDHLRVFTTSSNKYSGELKNAVTGYLKSHPLEELMRVNEGGQNIKIYIKNGATASQVKELLMFMDGGKSETVLLSLTGNFDLNDLSVLTEKMALPGGEQLKQAAKKQ